jgi:Bacterial capsule synthesis protein PGA_cap
VSVRDPHYDPRHLRTRRGSRPAFAHPASARPASARPTWLVPAVVALGLVVLVAAGFGGGLIGGSPAASTGLVAIATGSPGAASSTPTGTGSPADTGSPAATDQDTTGTPSATPAPSTVPADVAIVPVTNFRSGRVSVKAADVAAIATGTSAYGSLVLVKRDATAILAALGLDKAALGSRLATVASADALATALAKHRTWLGFLRADDVMPAVHALAWGSKALFGEGRVASLDAWPLIARLAVTPAAAISYDPARAWTLFAAGDLGLDRGAAVAMNGSSRGANFLFDGGSVAITGHCVNCSPFGWDLPYTRGTSTVRLVRSAISHADLAIANMEETTPNNWTFHAHGTVFTGNPARISGIANAGFDWVSMANNHVGDSGSAGVLQSMAHLDKFGILHGGAGATATAAHKPSIIDVKGVKVGIISYDTIAPVYNATATKAGSARMTAAALKRDIAAARKAGAQVVIVWPHWGVEYTAGPTAVQQNLAHLAIDDGADMVIGNHPHWAQRMEVYRGKPIWYALGNFTFDQTWSEPTMEGISLEMTFSGPKLVQVRIRPHLVMHWAQPNFMDPLGSGKVVMNQVFGGPKGLLSW